MTTNPTTQDTIEPPSGGSTTDDTAATPTVTFHQQAAAEVIAELDGIASRIPELQAKHISMVNFVRSHVNVPFAFLGTAIAGVEHNVTLQAVKKLSIPVSRDALQFIEAYRPVLDRLFGLAKDLQFTINSRHAELAADALQIYDITKGLARDPNSGEMAALAANLKRDLGRRGPKRKAPPADDPSEPKKTL